MSRTGGAADHAQAERVGRLLVLAQFVLLAWIGWRAWAGRPGAPWSHGAATGLLALSAAVALWALSANRPGNFNIRPTPRPGAKLVTTGPYRWIRHPMYTSLLLAAMAAVTWSSQRLVDTLLALALLAVLWAKASVEERALRQRFPGSDGYAAYQARSKRFLPWLV